MTKNAAVIREAQTSDETGAQVISLFPDDTAIQVAEVNEQTADTGEYADIDELYPASPSSGAPSSLQRALALLADCDRYAGTALERVRAGQVMDADGETEHLHAQLAGAFACDLGEGFKASISMLQLAIGSRGEPLSEQQILAVREVIRTVRASPYMPFEASFELEDLVENSGLAAAVEAMNGLDMQDADKYLPATALEAFIAAREQIRRTTQPTNEAVLDGE